MPPARSLRGLDAGEQAALVISECQQAMIVEEFRDVRDELAVQVRERGVVPAIAELAAAFRVANRPVVHSHLVPRADWSGFGVHCALSGVLRRTDVLKEGAPGAEPHPDLVPQPGDHVVARPTGLTSFEGTGLDMLLRNLDVDTVVLVGVSTNMAVFGTALEAVNRGYSVVIPVDCIAGVGPSQHVVAGDLLPLLATMSDHATVMGALRAGT